MRRRWRQWEFVDWFLLVVTVVSILMIAGLVLGTMVNDPSP